MKRRLALATLSLSTVASFTVPPTPHLVPVRFRGDGAVVPFVVRRRLRRRRGGSEPRPWSSSSSSSSLSSNGGAKDDDDSSSASSVRENVEVALLMSVLALQFGAQPTLVRRFVPASVCRSSVVLAQEVAKFALAFVGLRASDAKTRGEALRGWRASTALRTAGVPALVYLVQNLASLLAYQNLLPLTFNVLNQTKTLSAALCCWWLMGRKQSKPQILSLFLLLLSALVIERVVDLSLVTSLFAARGAVDSTATTATVAAAVAAVDRRRLTHGVLPILLASCLSGLAGALTQKNLQDEKGCGRSGGRNAYLFSMELNFFSALLLVLSLPFTRDGAQIRQHGLFHNWTPATVLPVATNALGGIVVGLVTKYAGSVRKGFALIFGILISGLFQAFETGAGVETAQVVGGATAALSLWLHTSYPYRETTPPPLLDAQNKDP